VQLAILNYNNNSSLAGSYAFGISLVRKRTNTSKIIIITSM
jgi:hypothetical protein